MYDFRNGTAPGKSSCGSIQILFRRSGTANFPELELSSLDVIPSVCITRTRRAEKVREVFSDGVAVQNRLFRSIRGSLYRQMVVRSRIAGRGVGNELSNAHSVPANSFGSL